MSQDSRLMPPPVPLSLVKLQMVSLLLLEKSPRRLLNSAKPGQLLLPFRQQLPVPGLLQTQPEKQPSLPLLPVKPKPVLLDS